MEICQEKENSGDCYAFLFVCREIKFHRRYKTSKDTKIHENTTSQNQKSKKD